MGALASWSRPGQSPGHPASLSCASLRAPFGRLPDAGGEAVDGDLSVAAPVLEAIYWSPSEDGEKFLTVNTQTRDAPAFCNLVLDWPEILEKR